MIGVQHRAGLVVNAVFFTAGVALFVVWTLNERWQFLALAMSLVALSVAGAAYILWFAYREDRAMVRGRLDFPGALIVSGSVQLPASIRSKTRLLVADHLAVRFFTMSSRLDRMISWDEVADVAMHPLHFYKRDFGQVVLTLMSGEQVTFNAGDVAEAAVVLEELQRVRAGI